MKTHSVFRNQTLIKEKVPTSELFNYLPAGSRFISGNTIKHERDPETGKLIEHQEIKAVYKLRQGGTMTFLEENN